MDEHTAKPPTPGSRVRQPREVTSELALEWERLRLERQKYALEVHLKRREFQKQEGKSLWKDLLTNPATIAIVGGILTLITAVITNYFSTSEARRADVAKARLEEQRAKETLEADLIKKFVESPRTETVRENLRFLVDAGLIPSYADSIRKYLDANPGVAPQVGGGVEFSPSGVSVTGDVKERIQKAVNQFIIYLQSLGFHGLDQNVSVFIFSKNKHSPWGLGDIPAAYYDQNTKTIFIHELLASDMSIALREYAHHALFVSLGSPDNYEQNEVESACADYLTASFTDSPVLYASLGPPSSKKLDSALSYDSSSFSPWERGTPWAAALWACRERVGQKAVDDLILPTWHQVMSVPREASVAQEFGKALMAATPPVGSCFSTEINARKLPKR